MEQLESRSGKRARGLHTALVESHTDDLVVCPRWDGCAANPVGAAHGLEPAQRRWKVVALEHESDGDLQETRGNVPEMASVRPSSCRFANSVEPSGEKQTPANSPPLAALRAMS